MGDRANIVLRDEDQPIYLYTHWTGYDLPETLRQALIKGQSRWGDTSYLQRVIFSTLTRGHEDEVTGFGLSTSMGDNSYPFLVVDDARQTVSVHPDSGHGAKGPDGWSQPIATFSFAAYVAKPRTWDNVTAREGASV